MSNFCMHPRRPGVYVLKFALSNEHLPRMMSAIFETYKTNNEGKVLDICFGEEDSNLIMLCDDSADCCVDFTKSYYVDKVNKCYWLMEIDQTFHDLLDPQHDLMARVQLFPGEKAPLIEVEPQHIPGLGLVGGI